MSLIGCGAGALFLWGLCWIVCGIWSQDQTAGQRLEVIIAALNDNWKVGLLVLIPLFFRPIRMFLERVEEAWGMKAPKGQRAAKAEPIGEYLQHKKD